MAIDAYAKVVYGFLVKQEALLKEVEQTFTVCDKCREEHDSGRKFCGHCGTKFFIEKKYELTDAAAKYAKDENYYGNTAEDVARDILTCVDSVQSPDVDATHYALAVNVESTGWLTDEEGNRNTASFAPGEYTLAMLDYALAKKAEALGIEPKAPMFFLTMCVG